MGFHNFLKLSTDYSEMKTHRLLIVVHSRELSWYYVAGTVQLHSLIFIHALYCIAQLKVLLEKSYQNRNIL